MVPGASAGHMSLEHREERARSWRRGHRRCHWMLSPGCHSLWHEGGTSVITPSKKQQKAACRKTELGTPLWLGVTPKPCTAPSLPFPPFPLGISFLPLQPFLFCTGKYRLCGHTVEAGGEAELAEKPSPLIFSLVT